MSLCVPKIIYRLLVYGFCLFAISCKCAIVKIFVLYFIFCLLFKVVVEFVDHFAYLSIIFLIYFHLLKTKRMLAIEMFVMHACVHRFAFRSNGKHLAACFWRLPKL